jgi:hypothetical protein
MVEEVLSICHVMTITHMALPCWQPLPSCVFFAEISASQYPFDGWQLNYNTSQVNTCFLLQVVGSLWEHCDPPNIDGLYTQNAKSYPGWVAKGWDSMCLHGNFVLISAEWWYRQDVQSFIDLVLKTGAHFRFRWNEQAVMAMAWQIFCPMENLVKFEFEYAHPNFESAATCLQGNQERDLEIHTELLQKNGRKHRTGNAAKRVRISTAITRDN